MSSEPFNVSPSILKLYMLQHNPLHAIAYQVQGLCSKTLEAKYKGIAGVSSVLQDQYRQGGFACIPASPEPVALVTSDGKIIAYRVPATSARKKLLQRLESRIPHLPPPVNTDNADRTDCLAWYYAVWSLFHSGSEPYYTADYYNQIAASKDSGLLALAGEIWVEASKLLEKVSPGYFKALSRCTLPSHLKRRAGLWMGFALNKGTENVPVRTKSIETSDLY